MNRGIFLVLIEKHHSTPGRNFPNHPFKFWSGKRERLRIRDHNVGLMLGNQPEHLRGVPCLAYHLKIRLVLQQTSYAFAQQPIRVRHDAVDLLTTVGVLALRSCVAKHSSSECGWKTDHRHYWPIFNPRNCSLFFRCR